MKKELRGVKYTEYSDGSGDYTNSGKFHRWGNKLIPQDNGIDAQKTVGIIEKGDGTIVEIDPYRIKFDQEEKAVLNW